MYILYLDVKGWYDGLGYSTVVILIKGVNLCAVDVQQRFVGCPCELLGGGCEVA